jgi:hypothetical protein
MMQSRPVTKEQKHWHDLLVNEVGCIACRHDGRGVNTYCSIHHVDGRTKRHAHWYVLPLCGPHHQTGGEGVALHHNKARFVARYGTEADLLAECAKIIATSGHEIPAGFLAWLDGPEVMA